MVPQRWRVVSHSSLSASVVGSGASRVALISIEAGSRPACSAERRMMSRLRIQSSSFAGMGVFHMSAWRPTSGSPICSPWLPIQIGGMGSGSGGAIALRMRKYAPSKLGDSSVHIRRQIWTTSSNCRSRVATEGKS